MTKRQADDLVHVGTLPRAEAARALAALAEGLRARKLRLRFREQDRTLLPRGLLLTELNVESGLCRGRLRISIEWDEETGPPQGGSGEGNT